MTAPKTGGLGRKAICDVQIVIVAISRPGIGDDKPVGQACVCAGPLEPRVKNRAPQVVRAELRRTLGDEPRITVGRHGVVVSYRLDNRARLKVAAQSVSI